MIYVDQLFACNPPWRGGRSCHMMSDVSVGELDAFAASIGIPRRWLQQSRGHFPHFDLSPRLRQKAIAAGARECTARELVRMNHARVNRGRVEAGLPPLVASWEVERPLAAEPPA